MEDRKLYRITVRGRVQGVGFRWSAANAAVSLGIAGYVRNMHDGSVFIEAEGPAEQLNVFVEWCREGPGIGHVDSVDIERLPPAGYDNFRIVH